MDNETFETLAEVLAFECKDSHAKYQRFCKIFYGDYPNKPPAFIDLGAMSSSQRGVTVYMHGAQREGHVVSYDLEHRNDLYADPSGYYTGYKDSSLGDYYTVRLELRVRF